MCNYCDAAEQAATKRLSKKVEENCKKGLTNLQIRV